VPTAVIAFDFDPFAHLGDVAVRWETVGIAVAIFAGLATAGLAVRSAGLRGDDLLFVVLGVVPGAVVGGRLGYILLHPAFFAEDLPRVIDPGTGSLELTLAVVGGAVTGALVAALLDGRPGRWVHAAAGPMLLTLGIGKLAMVLGGSGQGQPTAGEPATAYVGGGPWGSLAPALPSIPSQAIEGVATFVLLVVALLVMLTPAFRRADGRSFVVTLGAWSLLRLGVAATWRDPVVIGALRAEQVIDIVVAIGSVIALLALLVRSRRAGTSSVDRAPAAA
jgi:phosphatidylglycerol:prolipoprotein diacylglycerol transferase